MHLYVKSTIMQSLISQLVLFVLDFSRVLSYQPRSVNMSAHLCQIYMWLSGVNVEDIS